MAPIEATPARVAEPDSSPAPGETSGGRAVAFLRPLLASAIFATTFALLFLGADFTDDHFQWIAGGRQILAYGELPVRDFFDPGYFLQHVASAGAQLVFGDTLLGEAIMACFFLALGFAVTFLLAARMSGSAAIGLVMTGLVVDTNPRLYNYAKGFLLVLGLMLCLAYLERRSVRVIVALAFCTAIAFLFRHDYGVYIGVAAAVSLLAAHADDGRRALRRLAIYAATAATALVPFLLFLERSGGAVDYFMNGLQWSRSAAQGGMRDQRPSFAFDLSAPLWAIREPPPLPSARVNVRWSGSVTPEQRAELEHRYRLTGLQQLDEGGSGRSWRYELADPSPENVAALVRDPRVADTHYIDRATYRVTEVRSEPFLTSWRRAIPLFRLDIAPGILQAANALPWWYYLCLSLPGIAIVILAVRRFRAQPTGGLSVDAAIILATAVLCAVTHYALLRRPIGERLPDVAAPTAVLAAWLLSQCLGRPRWPVVKSTARCFSLRPSLSAVARQLVRSVGPLLLVAITWATIATVRGDGLWSGRAGILADPVVAVGRGREVAARLQASPDDVWIPPGRSWMQGLARYVRECTAPTEKVVVTPFVPDFYFHAKRGFATTYVPRGFEGTPSVREERETIARLRAAAAPIILIEPSRHDMLRLEFARVHEYLEANYRVARESDFGGSQPYRVLVDARRGPAGTYEPLGLPCYA